MSITNAIYSKVESVRIS